MIPPQKPSSFTEKMRVSGGDILLVRGSNKGRPLWHYVRVSKQKEPLLRHAVKSGPFDVADYGDILCSGWGKEPPENIRSKMESR